MKEVKEITSGRWEFDTHWLDTYNVSILITGIAQNERVAVLPSSPPQPQSIRRPSKSSRKSAVEEEELQTTPRAVAFATATTIAIVSLWRSSILPNLFGAAFVRGLDLWMASLNRKKVQK